MEAKGWEVWRDYLQQQSIQHWTSGQLADVFEQLNGVRYRPSHWCSLLRHQQGMYYYKPRPCDYRRADDAEEQLRARIQATFDALQAMGYDLQQVKWGFADEVAAQLHSNNARFWSFEPHLSRVVNTDRGSQSFRFGGPIWLLWHQRSEPSGRFSRWQNGIDPASVAGRESTTNRLHGLGGILRGGPCRIMPVATKAWKPGAGSVASFLYHCPPTALT